MVRFYFCNELDGIRMSGSAVERSPLAAEIGRVLAAGDTLSFTCRPPGQNLDDVS